MTFEEILDQAVAMLQHRGRVTYRTLKAQFQLDDDLLETLKDELLFSHPVVDEAGRGLVWTSDPAPPELYVQRETDAESRFHALLPDVMARLQRESRVTYRTLKYVFGIDDALVEKIREELTLRRLAIDDEDKVLVWTGEAQATITPAAALPASPEAVTVTSPSSTGTSSNGPTVPADAIATDAPQDESTTPPEPVRSAPRLNAAN
jgi:hypothetical protein